MAITEDGSNLFGITTTQVTATSKAFVIESFSETKSANRVDLNDGDGLPLGAVVVPQREEVSFTVQVGTTSAVPAVGQNISYAPVGANTATYVITDVTVNETQEDFVRLDLSAYKKTNNP